MKYRRLRRDELEGLTTAFTRFLAARGIPAEDWTRLKVTDGARTDALLDRFSELVIDDTLTRVTHLEERSARQLRAYRCGPDKLELRGLVLTGETALDFRRADEAPAAMLARLRSGGGRLQLASAERAYQGERNADLFRLLEGGARIRPDGELFDLLDGLQSGGDA